MNYFIEGFKNYGNFSGRARRKEYWIFTLLNTLILLLLSMVLPLISESLSVILVAFYALGILIPSLSVVVRRLHDTGRSGFWYFISFIPIIGGIWLFVLLCLEGTSGENKYGQDPKAELCF